MYRSDIASIHWRSKGKSPYCKSKKQSKFAQEMQAQTRAEREVLLLCRSTTAISCIHRRINDSLQHCSNLCATCVRPCIVIVFTEKLNAPIKEEKNYGA